MNYGMYLSAAAMRVHERRHDVIANNLANANTTAFKQDLVAVQSRPAAPEDAGLPGYLAFPLLDDLAGGLLPGGTHIDFSQGPLAPTGEDLDVALDGEGFLSVQVDGEVRFTRDGRLGRDAEGYLATQVGGHRVLDASGRPIRLPDGEAVTIATDGTLRAGDYAGRLGLFRFERPQDLRKVGGSLYQPADANAQRLAATPQVHQGFLEGSGVSEVATLVDMISVQRAYDASAKMIRMADQMLGRAVNDLARTA